MTSPTSLPLIQDGMIWDGITEYQNIRPQGEFSVYLLRMVEDGSRRWTERYATTNPMVDLIRRTTLDGWETIGITFENAGMFQADRGPVLYLDYDGSLTTEPVNQIPYLQEFQSHAARFAHQLDAAMGLHSIQSMEKEDRDALFELFHDGIASGTRRYAEWETIDPEELIIGGVNDGLLLWKHGPDGRDLASMKVVDEKLCGQCGFSTFLPLAAEKVDLAAARRAVRQGTVYVMDRSTTPWSLEEFDYLPTPYADAYEDLAEHFRTARHHYYTVVGHADVAS